MAAEQAIPISTRKVIVIHTRTIPQGITIKTRLIYMDFVHNAADIRKKRSIK